MALAALVVVIALLLVLGGTLSQRRDRWMERCQANGGTVRQVEPPARNPLLVQSDEPTYECRSIDGRVVARWR